MRSIQEYSQDWESNAKIDPYWAILTDPTKIDKKWDQDDFFLTGAKEIETLISYIRRSKLPIRFQGTCLDFGCGLGRLSRALVPYFDKVIGVDISQEMVSQASLLNPKVQFICNKSDTLRILPDASVHFIYSNIVLQHMNNQLQKKYIREFARVLEKGGWAIFQLPSLTPTFSPPVLLKRLAKRILPPSAQKILSSLRKKEPIPGIHFEMHCLSPPTVLKIAKEAGLELYQLAYTNSTDSNFNGSLEFYPSHIAKQRSQNFMSPLYFFRKK